MSESLKASMKMVEEQKGVRKIISKLSEAQKASIKYSMYNQLADNYFVENDDSTRLTTIRALENKGLISGFGGNYRYWLTDDGSAIRGELNET